MPELGAFIRALRKEKGMTQAALAQQLHLTDKAVSKWERGLSYPDISLFPKLADLLGVTVSDLLKEWDAGSRSNLVRFIHRTRDIRTPIHIILGCADLLEKYPDDPEKRQRYLDGIRISGQYLLEHCEKMHSSLRAGDVQPGDALTAYYDSRPERRRKPAYDFTGKRILVAEDMELNREIAREIIRQTGAEPTFADDGAVCLAMLKAAPPGYYDMILMDISMPNMDGIEATRQIRRLEDEKAAIPIIAMTANVDIKDRETAFEAGMNDFAEKPVDLDRLYAAMQKYL